MISADVVYMREEMLRRSHHAPEPRPIELPRSGALQQAVRWARSLSRRGRPVRRAVPVRVLLEAVAEGELSPEAAHRLLRRAA